MVVNLQPLADPKTGAPDPQTASYAKALQSRPAGMDTRHADEHTPLEAAPGSVPNAPADSGVQAGGEVSADLGRLDRSSEELMIVGHGNLERVQQGATDLHATSVANKSPAEMVDWMVANGLPKTYTGTIVLVACHAGTGDEASYAKAVHGELVQRGYRFVDVKAPTGAVAVGTVTDLVRENEGEYPKEIVRTSGLVVDDDHDPSLHGPDKQAAYLAQHEKLEPLRAKLGELKAEKAQLEQDIARIKSERLTPKSKRAPLEKRVAWIDNAIAEILVVGTEIDSESDAAYGAQPAGITIPKWREKVTSAGSDRAPEATVRIEAPEKWWETEVNEYQASGGVMQNRLQNIRGQLTPEQLLEEFAENDRYGQAEEPEPLTE